MMFEEHTPRAVKPDWVVTEAVSDEQLHRHALVSSVVWNLDPVSTKTAVKERRRYVDFSHRRGGYLVVRDGEKYVGHASYRVSADGQTMYLIGGALMSFSEKPDVPARDFIVQASNGNQTL